MGAGTMELPLSANGDIVAGKVKVGANKVIPIQGDLPFPNRKHNLSCEPKGHPVLLKVEMWYKRTGAFPLPKRQTQQKL